MRKIFSIILFTVAACASIFAFTFFGRNANKSNESAEANIGGYWNLTDVISGKLDSIVLMYEKDGVFYGRMVAIYDDNEKLTDTFEDCKQTAKGLDGSKPLCSFDFISGLKWDAGKKKYTGGKLLDPDSGNSYDCESWKSADKDEIEVVCQVAIFWKTMHWTRAKKLPDGAEVNPKKLSPVIIN